MGRSANDADKGGRHRPLFVALLVLLAWLPVPLGSNRPWSSALMAGGALLLLAIWLVGQIWRPSPLPSAALQARPVWLALCASVLYILIQVLPLPVPVASVLSPYALALYQTVAPDAGAVPLSIDRGATLFEFLKLSAYSALFYLVLVLATSRRRVQLLCGLLILAGTAQALYGMVAHLAHPWLDLWRPGHIPSAVSGTYVNRNHFAGFLELCAGLTLGLALTGPPGRSVTTDWRSRLAAIPAWLLDRRAQLLFPLLLMLAALVMSTSRGGMAAFGMAVAGGALVSAWLRGRAARGSRVAGSALAVVIVAVAWLGTGGTTERLLSEGLTSNRAQLHVATWQMLSQSPWFGTGAGTFQWSFAPRQDERFGGLLYDHAHNDYLELVSDQGLVGALLLGFAMLYALVLIGRGVRQRQDPFYSGVLLGVFIGAVSLLIHALVDFNFHIPANAAYFFVLLGLGVVAASQNRGATAAGGPRDGS